MTVTLWMIKWNKYCDICHRLATVTFWILLKYLSGWLLGKTCLQGVVVVYGSYHRLQFARSHVTNGHLALQHQLWCLWIYFCISLPAARAHNKIIDSRETIRFLFRVNLVIITCSTSFYVSLTNYLSLYLCIHTYKSILLGCILQCLIS